MTSKNLAIGIAGPSRPSLKCVRVTYRVCDKSNDLAFKAAVWTTSERRRPSPLCKLRYLIIVEFHWRFRPLSARNDTTLNKTRNTPFIQTMNALAKPVQPAQDGRNFPTKLHQCLTELEREGLGHIASFQPHGRCFLVHKQEEFVRQVLPRYVYNDGSPYW
jgi:HSF-type DNA-binding